MLNKLLKQIPLSIPCVYEKDNAIYLEGDYCDKIGVILSGTVELVHYSNSGNSNVLSTLKKGETFGDVMIFSDYPYYIGALIAKEKTKVAYLTKDVLTDALNDKTFQTKFIQNLSNKAFNFNKQVKLLKQPLLKDKVLFYLETKSQEHKQQKVYINSITTLANDFNVQRPSLSRVMKSLLDSNIIKRNGKWYWLDS